MEAPSETLVVDLQVSALRKIEHMLQATPFPQLVFTFSHRSSVVLLMQQVC